MRRIAILFASFLLLVNADFVFLQVAYVDV
jgi:hypothetical protein